MTHTLSQTFSLLDPELLINPYPIYKNLRTEAPVYWDEKSQAWLISRYSDVTTLLRDPRFSAAPVEVEWESREQIMKVLADVMQFGNPPRHTHIRGLVEKAFFPRFPLMREKIQQLVDGLLDKVQESRRMDIISDLAEPLPFMAITELVGVQIEDRTQFRQWVESFANFAITTSHSPTTPEEDQQVLENLLALSNYFRPLVEQRMREPKDDVITALTQVEMQGEKLSFQGVLANSIQLTVAGFVPITSQVGIAMLLLLDHPNQMQKLKNNPALIESAVEEILRYDSFVQWVSRRAVEDIELYGQLIRKNQVVRFGLGSANRDEKQFIDPDRFDITRTNNRHVGFGFGAHTCIGAAFTRLQMQIIIESILRRLKNLRIETNDTEWLGTPTFRIPASVPILFEPS